MEKKKFDPVVPSHYMNGGMELYDILKAKFSREELKGFLRGNALKYIFRYDMKGGALDLEKSRWYLNKLIELEQSK